MKEDNLEQFIRSHSTHFDDKKAPSGLWTEIEKELHSPLPKAINGWKYLALLFGTLLLATLVYLSIARPDANGRSIDTPQLQFAELPDFVETEKYYQSAIYASEKKLSQHHMDATLDQDLSLLDLNGEKLKLEYLAAQGAYKEQILRAMILNYKTKLQILEHVLINIEKKESDEKIY